MISDAMRRRPSSKESHAPLALAALAAVRSFRHAGPRCRRRCPLNSRGVRLSARTGGHTQLQFGRLCGALSIGGRDAGAILISEGLPHPYICGRDELPATTAVVLR